MKLNETTVNVLFKKVCHSQSELIDVSRTWEQNHKCEKYETFVDYDYGNMRFTFIAYTKKEDC